MKTTREMMTGYLNKVQALQCAHLDCVISVTTIMVDVIVKGLTINVSVHNAGSPDIFGVTFYEWADKEDNDATMDRLYAGVQQPGWQDTSEI